MASNSISSKNNKSLSAMDTSATLTPLSSTRDNAPFTIQIDSSSDSSAFTNKMRIKTVILQSVPEGRSVRAESSQSAQSQQQQVQCPVYHQTDAAAKGEWNASLVGFLDFRKGCSDFLVLACCPCIPAAKIHGMLGSSFETGVMYFGGLVFGMLVSLGLCSSNTSAATVTDLDIHHTSSTHLYGNLGLVLLALFLVGVALLRTRTRHRFNISGSRAFDCLLSLACCWCVLSQSQRHFEKHNRHEFGLDTPTDTLPAYS